MAKHGKIGIEKRMPKFYYNENNKFAANWLKNLISKGLLPKGDVDERSITEVNAQDLEGYDQCHFFTGIGGWPYAIQLCDRQNEKGIWTGSCPCQPFSDAGKQKGFEDERHLWPVFCKLIKDCKPNIVFGEQVASKIALEWLDNVINDLENADYTGWAADLCAASVGAPHIRQRLYWGGIKKTYMAYTISPQRDGECACPERSYSNGHTRTRWDESRTKRPSVNLFWQPESKTPFTFWRDCEWLECTDGFWRAYEPGVPALVDGVPQRVGRMRGYGNAIVPQVAAVFMDTVFETLNELA